MGTDMGFEPTMGSNAYELEIYCELGMKPMDAIMTATKNAAKALHLDHEIGTLEKGKSRTSSSVKAIQPHQDARSARKHQDGA